MKIVFLDADTLGEGLDFSAFYSLGEVVMYGNTPNERIAENIADADVVIVNKEKLNKDTIETVPNLKLICVAATGYDNIDIEYMRKRNIGVCNVVGYSTDSVAQLTLSMAFSLYSHLTEYRESVASGKYSTGAVANILSPVYHELAGKTWGVIGLGNIGRKVYDVASAIGCNVLGCKRTPIDGYNCVDIDTVIAQSDIISVHTPLNDQTRGLISKDRIEKMKDGAIVINVARGAVIDEAALCNAVKSGKLAGIGVDVYSTEPFGCESPYYEIRNMPNVCLTPHMAWGALEARKRCLEDIVKSIISFKNGEKYSRIV